MNVLKINEDELAEIVLERIPVLFLNITDLFLLLCFNLLGAIAILFMQIRFCIFFYTLLISLRRQHNQCNIQIL